MPIGKDKKSVQGYVKTETKDKIVKLAKDQERSESYIVGNILDQALTPTTKEK